MSTHLVTPGPEERRPRRHWVLRFCFVLVFFLLVAVGAWCGWVYSQIAYFAGMDQATPSDAIVVFGAAEWDGRPSPVFRARLNHALTLYKHGIAPLVITLGGDGGDEYSEGGVGRNYLMTQGVPETAIIAETQSRTTSESARRVEVIARANHLQRLVIVSDGSHLFRIHAICAADGLNVLTSPRPQVVIADRPRDFERYAHEILAYTLWRLRLD
jgi:uncharacterized SAM-binding protein YcdF (DUF218 family)